MQAAPTARRQGSRPPSQTAAAAAAEPVAPRRSSPAPGDRGVRIPAAAVEVFNIAAGDSDQDGPAADDPGARRRGSSRSRGASRSRRGQSVAMAERIADSREEAGLPDILRQRNTTTPGVKLVSLPRMRSPRDPQAHRERTIAAPGAGRGRQTLAMVTEIPPLPQRIGIGHIPGVVAFPGALQNPIRSLRTYMVALTQTGVMSSVRSELTPRITTAILGMMGFKMKALRQALRLISRGSPPILRWGFLQHAVLDARQVSLSIR